MNVKKRKRIIIISVSAAAVVLTAALIVLLVVLGNRNNVTGKPEPTSATQTETAPTVLPTVAATEVSTGASERVFPTGASETKSDVIEKTAGDDTAAEEETLTAVTSDSELDEILELNSNTAQELYEMGCRQLVTVQSSGSSATIDFFTFEDGAWKHSEDMTCSGYVGSNGVTYDMYEGGYASPAGLFPVGEAFYIYEQPATGLSSFQITEDTYWVDDPDSAYYNQRVDGRKNKDWNSAEHMIDYASSYEYGFVVDYNTDAEYNKGSAIFFHISDDPTAGCIGTSRDDVLLYLSALDESLNPYILIV